MKKAIFRALYFLWVLTLTNGIELTGDDDKQNPQGPSCTTAANNYGKQNNSSPRLFSHRLPHSDEHHEGHVNPEKKPCTIF